MALLSTKGIYGLRALYELSSKDLKTPTKLREIADLSNISLNYLEQIFTILKKEGFVKSIRGAEGGYMLAKPASQISILSVIEALEGELQIANKSHLNDPLKLFYLECQKVLEDFFDIPLSNIKEYHLKLLGQLNYTI